MKQILLDLRKTAPDILKAADGGDADIPINPTVNILVSDLEVELGETINSRSMRRRWPSEVERSRSAAGKSAESDTLVDQLRGQYCEQSPIWHPEIPAAAVPHPDARRGCAVQHHERKDAGQLRQRPGNALCR